MTEDDRTYEVTEMKDKNPEVPFPKKWSKREREEWNRFWREHWGIEEDLKEGEEPF